MQKESLQSSGTNKQIYEWIKRYQDSKDEDAQLQIVKHYEALVKSLSRKFSRGYDHDEDMYQVGVIGLLAAIDRYDEDFGRTFESFAIPTIVGEIKRHIRDKTWSIHVPRRIKELGPKIKKAVEILTNEKQRSPLVKEIAEYLEVSEEAVLETMEMGKNYQALSVDRSLDADQEGGEVTLLELVGKEEVEYERTDLRLLLEKAFHILTDREKQILQYTYYENLSQKETGEKLGISQMHVSRLQRKALEKLKQTIQVEPTEIL